MNRPFLFCVFQRAIRESPLQNTNILMRTSLKCAVFLCLNFKEKFKYVAHIVDIDATLACEIDEFGLEFDSVIDKANSRHLSLTGRVYYRKSCGIVHASASSLGGVDKSVMSASTLEVVGVIAIEFRKDVVLGEYHSSDAVFFVGHAVFERGENKLEKSRSVCGVASDDAVIFTR